MRLAQLRNSERCHSKLFFSRRLTHQVFVTIECEGRLEFSVRYLRQSLFSTLNAYVLLHFVVVGFEIFVFEGPVCSVAVDGRGFEIVLDKAKRLPAPMQSPSA